MALTLLVLKFDTLKYVKDLQFWNIYDIEVKEGVLK
jgi:hypothetical protein